MKTLREENGMTQQELANIVGGDRQYINKVESGKKNITLNYLDKVAAALKVSQSNFLNTNS